MGSAPSQLEAPGFPQLLKNSLHLCFLLQSDNLVLHYCCSLKASIAAVLESFTSSGVGSVSD